MSTQTKYYWQIIIIVISIRNSTAIFICWFLEMVNPKVTMGFNTKSWSKFGWSEGMSLSPSLRNSHNIYIYIYIYLNNPDGILRRVEQWHILSIWSWIYITVYRIYIYIYSTYPIYYMYIPCVYIYIYIYILHVYNIYIYIYSIMLYYIIVNKHVYFPQTFPQICSFSSPSHCSLPWSLLRWFLLVVMNCYESMVVSDIMKIYSSA